ncbi:nuclear transport factor 2 family protein [Frankia sp. Cas3]|uniref:nuclear transport factor 2 family protein n=1 Tax=Frankia sp. Cas3 TaxID=3073926 RepID=UPI002AD48D2E|nr:nuclear transport factor 2 family protein [Frankia sp. Cas3]
MTTAPVPAALARQLAELAELADRGAILDVVAAYATALDTRTWAALDGLFTDDAVCTYGGSIGDLTGQNAIIKSLRSVLEPLDATQHQITNSVVRVHGDTAEHTAYVHAQHVRHGVPGGELYTIGARYDDQLRRTPDGWRFTRRELTRIWTDGNRGVLHP